MNKFVDTPKLTYGRALVNIRAFLKDEELSQVIKFLGLIPDHEDWKIWNDPLGYVVKFKPDKTYSIEIKPWKGQINDLYFKSSFDQILDNSIKLYSLLELKRELCLLGKDQKLRKFYFSDHWERKSCLSSSLEELKKVIRILSVEQEIPQVWKLPLTLEQRKMLEELCQV